MIARKMMSVEDAGVVMDWLTSPVTQRFNTELNRQVEDSRDQLESGKNTFDYIRFLQGKVSAVRQTLAFLEALKKDASSALEPSSRKDGEETPK